jgi:archaemetzincin
MNDRIVLIPAGKVEPDDLLYWLSREIKQIFSSIPAEVEVHDTISIPGHAYHAERQQYLASEILYDADEKLILNGKGILLVDRDLFATGLNYIFGQAHPENGLCIFSITRLKPGFYGQAEDEEVLKKRALKEAVHELGHLYGLSHCIDPECAMFFSNSLTDTDRKSPHFCKQHEKLLLEV